MMEMVGVARVAQSERARVETMEPENGDLELLRALCRCDALEESRRAVERLRTHAWKSGESQILFEACARLVRRGAKITRQNLASEVTRAGFPDVDLDALFAPREAGNDGSRSESKTAKRLGKTR